MDISALVAGILSILITAMMQYFIMNNALLEADAEDKGKTLLPQSKSKVDCDKLQLLLFYYTTNKDVYRVQNMYPSYVKNCFKDDKKKRDEVEKYFENFVDSFLNDEELKIEHLTRKNTQRNREYTLIPMKQQDDHGEYNSNDEADCNRVLMAPSSPTKVAISFSPEQKIKKKVQINPELQIKLIKGRKKNDKDKKRSFIVVDESINIAEID